MWILCERLPNEKVNFLIGENENLNISSDYVEEQFDSGLDVEEEISDNIFPSDPDVIITKGVTVTMKTESYSDNSINDSDKRINITEVPFTSPEVTRSSPAPLVSLMCCSEKYMAGTVLQGCFKQSSESWRAHLQSDLL